MASLPSYSIVEFPGKLRDRNDASAAFACFGGEQAVCQATGASFRAAASAPTLNLRTGPHASPSNIQPEKPVHLTNLFLLEVDIHQFSASTQADDLVVSRRSNEFIQKSLAHGQVIARVDTLIRYRSLADYCFHTRNGVQPPLNNDSTSNQVAANCVFRTLLQDRQATQPQHSLVDRLRPRRFARAAPEYGTFDYWFRQYSCGDAKLPTRTELIPNHPLGDDRRSDVNRIALLHHRVPADVAQVPEAPGQGCSAPVIRGRSEFEQCVQLIRRLFNVRPVWVRRALQEGIPKQLARQFKRVIPQVAYAFQGTGPFYQAWIRYGYDPRKDPNSRKYQTVEVRITNALIIAARAQCDQDNERAALEIDSQGNRSGDGNDNPSSDVPPNEGPGDGQVCIGQAVHFAQPGSSCVGRELLDTEDDIGREGDGDALDGIVATKSATSQVANTRRKKSKGEVEEVVGEGTSREVSDDNVFRSKGGTSCINQKMCGGQENTGTREANDFGGESRNGADQLETQEFPGSFRMPSSFTLSQIPRKRNNFIQVCDITLPEVVRFCEQEQVTDSFDKRFGFFSQVGHEKLMKTIKDTLVKMSKQRLGAERVGQIIRGDYSSVSDLMVNRKRRVFLKDVIRPRKRFGRDWSQGLVGSGMVSQLGDSFESEAVERVKDLNESSGGSQCVEGCEDAGEEELAEVDGFALLEEDDENEDEDDDDDDDVEGDEES
ncbi:unnamed protein product [Agarophyton chilense]|eukprot:gb/GEZJ01001703.1/.p1 GENE.gb/GEZJ01001703.1/~~gb/GEZJ01001703.1/.p1  ORF type:complete len:717 (-),score=83.32 gb/GEZJ01001703.1/:4347-6497(-)